MRVFISKKNTSRLTDEIDSKYWIESWDKVWIDSGVHGEDRKGLSDYKRLILIGECS